MGAQRIEKGRNRAQGEPITCESETEEEGGVIVVRGGGLYRMVAQMLVAAATIPVS